MSARESPQDFPSLLQLIGLAYERLQEENNQLARENERLNLESSLLQAQRLGYNRDNEQDNGSKLPLMDQHQEAGSDIWQHEVNNSTVSNEHLLANSEIDNPKDSLSLSNIMLEPVLSTCSEMQVAKTGMQVPNPSTDLGEQYWYVGEWIDNTGSFYSGGVISMDKHAWEPQIEMYGHYKFLQDARYSLVLDNVTGVVFLSEHRADGAQRQYRAIRGPSDTMIVSLKGTGLQHLTWTLVPYSRLRSGEFENMATQMIHSVSHDELSDAAHPWQTLLENMITSSAYQIFIGLLVAFSSIVVGLQSCKCLRSKWFIIDSIIVIVSACYQWFIQNHVDSESGFSGDWILVLRSLRFLRVTRVLRKLIFLKSSWMLISGLLSSAPVILSALAVLLIINFLFACIGMEIIARSNYLQGHELDGDPLKTSVEKFNGLYTTMITLFQFVIMDDVISIYTPLIKADPWLILYFLPLLMTVSISLMNVVTSVIVETAIKTAQEDELEQQSAYKEKIIAEQPIFIDFFQNIPKKIKAFVHKSEFEDVEPQKLPDLVKKCITHFNIMSMGELFDILDKTASGKITEKQFVEGMLNLSLAELGKVPAELLLVLKHLRMSKKQSEEMEKTIVDIHAQTAQLWAAITDVASTMRLAPLVVNTPSPTTSTKHQTRSSSAPARVSPFSKTRCSPQIAPLQKPPSDVDGWNMWGDSDDPPVLDYSRAQSPSSAYQVVKSKWV